MKKETLEMWLIQLDSIVATLNKANHVRGLISSEQQALTSLKDAVDCFEKAIEEREPGIRIPPGLSGGSALDRKV
jgi:hypothetical protein